jgi:hypothetical protein
MKKFSVSIREHIIRDYLVEAESIEEAKCLAMEGEFIEVISELILDCNVSHTEEV